jgi:sec-independent protein translocase protein TatC
MEKESTILEHLEEFRRRVITVLAAVLFLSILCYPLTDEVLIKIKRDLLDGYGDSVIVTTPVEAVLVRLKLSVLLSAFITVPLLVYEVFMFLAPGLYSKEKKWFTVTVLGSFILFITGAVFTYLVLLPFMLRFLLGFATPVAQPLLVLDKLVSFIVLLMAGMGLVFQWPLVVGVLSALGVVSPGFLAKRRRYAVVGCFILGAVFTDPTFITQVIVAVPLMVLYEAGILVARGFHGGN